MEQKQFKILFGAIIASIVISMGALAFAMVSYQKVAVFGRTGGEQPSTAPVDLGPTSMAGFAGKPISATVTSLGGTKTIELRGHELKDPTVAYEAVSGKDTTKKKVIIDSNTKFYRVELQGKKAPKISDVTFDQYTTALTSEVYIVSYEAKEGNTITDSTPATIISIFVKS